MFSERHRICAGRKGFLFVLRRKFYVLSPQRRSKRPKPAGNADFFKITDHLKPPTVAKRCTFLESRKSPALRGFVAGRWALATTSLYPSTKIERPQSARKGAPRRRSSSGIECSGWPGLPRHDCLGQPNPTRGPTPPKCPRQGHRLRPFPQTGTQGAHGRDRGLPAGVCPFPEWVRATPANSARLPLAASQVLCLPHP